MHRFVRLRPRWAAVLLALAGCLPEFGAENPYDPASPRERQATAELRGVVIPEVPIPRAEARILGEGGEELGRADPEGRFTLALPPGRAALSVVAPDHRPYELGVLELGIGERRELGALHLVAQRGRIAGTVALEGEGSLAGTLVSASGVERAAITGGTGAFALAELPVGRYTLVLLHPGFATGALEQVVVAASRTTTVAATLQRLAADADFAISGGARYVATASVTLELYGFELPLIQVSEDPSFADLSAWQPFAGATHPYRLSPGDGLKRVYVRFARAADDPASWSRTYAASVTLDTAPPVLQPPRVDDGSGYTRERAATVTLSLTAFDLGSGLEGLRVSVDGALDTEAWAPFAPVRVVTLDAPQVDGPKTLLVEVRDLAGNRTAPLAATVVLDTAAPGLARPPVRIDGGAAYARSPAVTLALGSDDAAWVAVGDAPGLGARGWLPYPSGGSLAHQLPPGDGPKTVYVRFKDAAGNESPEYSDDILLDTTPPAGVALVLAGGAPRTREGRVPVALVAAEPWADVSVLGDLLERGTYAPGALTELTLTAGDGPKVVTAVLTDEAGNPSSPLVAAVVLDTTPPGPGTLTVAGGRGVVAARAVSVSIGDTSADTMDLYEAAGPAGCGTPACGRLGALPFASPTTFTLSAGDGPKTVCLRLCDEVGNGSAVSARTLTLDTTAPALGPAPVVIDGGAAATRSPFVRLDLGAPTAAEVLVGDAPGLAAGGWLPYPPSGALTWLLPPGDGPKTVYVRFRDEAGNETPEAAASITLDTTPPAAPAVALGGGRAAWNDRVIALSLGPAELGATVVLAGDLVEAGRYPVGAVPASVTLADGDGVKAVSAQLIDAAGNPSPVASDFVTLDTAPPADGRVTLGEGASAWASATLPVEIAGTTPDTMQLWEAPSGACVPRACAASGWVPYAASASLTLSAGEGSKTVCWRFCDLAGNGSATGTGTILLDTIPPGLAGPALVIEGGATVARSPVVTVSLGAVDATAVELGDDPSFVGRGFEPYPPSGVRTYTLPPGDGPKTVYARFRDAAGNQTPPYAATITLDTARPAAGALTLAGGASTANTPAVTLAVAGSEGDLSLTLLGDLVAGELRTYAPGAWPSAVQLSAGDGPKLVTGVLLDAAGNASLPFSDLVVLDTAAPADGVVTLANGQAVVSAPALTVLITATAPDTMQLWEPAGASCGVRACGTSGYVPFSAASSFTLAPAQGVHTVCWRFCDDAGNGSTTGSARVTLSTFLERPRPTLSSVTPANLVASSEPSGVYVLTVAGAGLAFDTQALVGDYTLPCASTGAGACQADLDGGCGSAGACAATCASSCTVALPASLVRNGGTHGLRLSTPAPVVNGESLSSAIATFSVLAPPPHIDVVRPRGVLQDTTASGGAIAQTLTLSLRGTGLMDNVAFRLGPNTARVLSMSDVNYRTRELTLEVSTAGLAPSDLEDQRLVAVNPSPGGGEHSVAFGLSPRVTDCPLLGACGSNLRATRARSASGRGTAQAYAASPRQASGLVPWTGGTAAALRRQDGALAARVLAAHAGHLLPFVPGALGAPLDSERALARVPSVTLEDALGTGPRTALGAALGAVAGRGSGAFLPGVARALGDDPRGVELADLDGDGLLEPVTVNHAGDDLAIGWADAPPTHLATPHAPVALAVADLDGDGRLDVVAVGEEVALHLGAGGRAFAPVQTVDMGGDPTAVAVGDLDRDGAPDLVVTSATGLLRTRLGNGDGTFRELTTIPGFGALSRVTLGDVSGDGVLDFVTASAGSTNVSVFLGNGAGGTVPPRSDLVMGPGSVSVALADVNLDGALDVLSPNGSSAGTVSMRLGNGDGTFRALNTITLGAAPREVRVADLNGDGYPDLVGAGANAANTGGALLVRLGNGDGTFQSTLETSALAGANALALGDVNLDGAPDVYLASGAADAATLFQGRPAGHGGQLLVLPGGTPDGQSYAHAPVVPADVNRDGLPDLLAPSRGSGANVSYLPATAGGGYAPAVSVPMGVHTDGLAFGDLNGDGLGDLVSTDLTTGLLYLRLGDGLGGFGAASTHAMGAGPVWVALGDLNADGTLDVLTANQSSNNVSVRLGNGDGTLRAAANYAVGSTPLHALLADVDADGDLDILTANAGANGISVLRNGGAGTFVPAVNTACGTSPRALAVGDLNADGAPDVVCAGGSAGLETATVLLGNGNATFAAGVPYDMGAGELHVAVHDLNGDGLLDLVSANGGADSDLGVRLGRGDGAFDVLARYPSLASPNGLALADMNGDGAPDVLMGSGTTGELGRWTLPTPSSWAEELTELPAASNLVLPGTNTFTVGQAPFWVDKVSVRVRLTDPSARLGLVTLTLTSPRGEVIVLDGGASHAGATVWQSSYPTAPPVGSLTAANGWQPAGSWALTVQNAGPGSVILEDYAVVLHGAFQRPAPGSSAAIPERLTFRTGTRWKQLEGSTLGAADGTGLSCVLTRGATSGPGEHWYELSLATANTLQELSVIAPFDAAVELRRGTCASAGTVLGCDDDGWGGRNPRLTGSYALAAGTYCVVVDGVYAAGAINAGSYQLYLRLANNL